MERDENGVLHVVALSGGHDSTIMSLELIDREPGVYNYLCTPTGNELPEMFSFWRWLGSDEMLGKPLVPIMADTGLGGLIERENCIPNRKRRFCTRALKIEPYRQFLKEQAAIGPVVSYVGLRADEEGRAGGAFSDIEGVEMRFPLREWGWGEDQVQAGLAARGIVVPERTDCAWCYHQQIGEWWVLWHSHRELFNGAIALEEKMGHTFREPKLDAGGAAVMAEKHGVQFAASSRDTWPAKLADMARLFELGAVPTVRRDPRAVDLFRRSGACRACTL